MIVLALSSLVACGTDEESAPTGDPPVVGWIDDGAPPVAAPDIPWRDAGLVVAPPTFSCLDGWTPVTLDDGATVCEPWPNGEREDCASATATHLPGTAGCVEIGAACPADGWPAELPATGVWFVAPGGEGDGTSADTPLGALAAAIAAAADGDTIALAAGDYDEAVTITGEVTIRGACAAETRLTASTIGEDEAVVTVTGGTLTMSDLQVSDASGMGIQGTDAVLTLEGLAVLRNTTGNLVVTSSSATLSGALLAGGVASADGTGGYGILATGGDVRIAETALLGNTTAALYAAGASVDVSATVLAGTASTPADGTGGYSIRVVEDTRLTVAGVVVEGGHDDGVRCEDSACTVADLVVRDVASNGEITSAIALIVYSATLSAERVWIERAGYAGVVSVHDEGGATVGLTLTDVVIRESGLEDLDRQHGYGLLASGPIDVDATRVASVDNTGEAFFFEAGVVATLTDLRGKRSGEEGIRGVGLGWNASDVTASRVWLADNPGGGVFAYDEDGGTTFDVSDLYVGTAEGGTSWVGVYVPGAGSGTLSRVVIEGAAGAGLWHTGTGALTVTDAAVSGTVASDDLPGAGLYAGEGAPVTLERVEFADTIAAGAWLTGPATVTDLRVSGVASGGVYEELGVGVFAEGATLGGARWDIADTHGAGVALVGAGLTLADLHVSGVAPRSCVQTTCQTETAATGVWVDADSTLALTTFLVEGADGVGLQSAGAAEATDGWVRDAAFGTEAVSGGGLTLTRVDTTGADAPSPDDPTPTPSMEERP